MSEEDKNITFGTLRKLYDDIEKLNRTNDEIFKANETLTKEIKRLQKENKKLKLCLGILSPSRVLLEGKYWEKDDNEEIERLNNIINELENRDDVLEEFEDWLERQKTRNSEWDNFIMVDGRLGIPISYLLDKLQELKGSVNNDN